MIKKFVNQHIEEKYVENKTLYIMYKKAKCQETFEVKLSH